MRTKRVYFYHKQNKKIVPSHDSIINQKALIILNDMSSHKDELGIPKKFVDSWDKVSLYSPTSGVDEANALILDPSEGAYDLSNKLNNLTGKEWTKFTCSWFIFNAIPADIRAEKELDPNIEDHPATFSPTMIADFINFFTKEGEKVIDPFLGIGSTLEACKRTNRIGYGIELSKKYYELSLKREPEFAKNIINGDSRKISEYKLPEIDFAISSPPYWNILNRSTRNFKKNRTDDNLDYKYSEHQKDVGNIDDYNVFMDALAEIYFELHKVLRKGAYNVVIVKNIKKGGQLYPIAWDLASRLSKKYILKDEKIWIQDKASLAPYGYPYSWASNILHHYCLIMRKE